MLAALTVLALRAGERPPAAGAATAAIAPLPVIYLVFPARNRGGNEFGYPNDLVGAHWVALAAVLSLLAAGL